MTILDNMEDVLDCQAVCQRTENCGGVMVHQSDLMSTNTFYCYLYEEEDSTSGGTWVVNDELMYMDKDCRKFPQQGLYWVDHGWQH